MDIMHDRSRMKKSLIKLFCALTAVITVFAALPITACNKEPASTHFMKESDYLMTSGTDIKNDRGETVYLRGINAGGLFVIEQWMTGFASTTSQESSVATTVDHKTTSQVFIERFGEEGAKELWKTYQENWWTETDFEYCLEMGINCIRLPFTYMTVDFAAVSDYDKAGKNFDFTPLGDFVKEASKYGIYTILDLHGAYDSQNGQDHSGEVKGLNDVDFYSNEQMQNLTVKLLQELALYFKDNPAVAAIDILNEPGEKSNESGSKTYSTTVRHWDFFDKAYKAIREVDDHRIVIFESCWEAENLPYPSQYGWENCIYSFHHYTGCTGQDRYQEHCTSFANKLAQIGSKNFGVPLHMGEFTCYDNADQWEYTLNLLNSSKWHWNSWTYKTWINSAWGVLNIKGRNNQKINAHNDSYETIMEKFSYVRTTEETAFWTFNNNKTLFDIIKASLKTEET